MTIYQKQMAYYSEKYAKSRNMKGKRLSNQKTFIYYKMLQIQLFMPCSEHFYSISCKIQDTIIFYIFHFL
ncbi:hypothetical protein D5278_15280 [bacterium 1XD21-13]|nr:hypothetical protein [bacterium 1XD21-13]